MWHNLDSGHNGLSGSRQSTRWIYYRWQILRYLSCFHILSLISTCSVQYFVGNTRSQPLVYHTFAIRGFVTRCFLSGSTKSFILIVSHHFTPSKVPKSPQFPVQFAVVLPKLSLNRITVCDILHPGFLYNQFSCKWRRRIRSVRSICVL